MPIGVKELDPVKGSPKTEASLVFKDRVAEYDPTTTAHLREAGAVLVGQTTASEFGGINCTCTRLHGTTSNPYDLVRTPEGSLGGSAASVSVASPPWGDPNPSAKVQAWQMRHPVEAVLIWSVAILAVACRWRRTSSRSAPRSEQG